MFISAGNNSPSMGSMAWLNVAEAARSSGLAERTVRNACANGRLHAIRKSSGWLIHENDLKRWHETPEIHKPGPKSVRDDEKQHVGQDGSPSQSSTPGHEVDDVPRSFLKGEEPVMQKLSTPTKSLNKGEDTVSKEVRSRIMAAVGTKNTKPEVSLRSILHRMGFRFRLHVKGLAGRPDIVISKYRTAIFVHGCFWHRHPGCKKTTTPAQNASFWQDKFVHNQDRDERKKRTLEAQGWTVIVVWECEIMEKPNQVAERLRAILIKKKT